MNHNPVIVTNTGDKEQFIMNITHKANKELFAAKARWACECSRGTRRYIPCGKPATHVLEGQDEDGDQRMLLCGKHAAMVDKRIPLDWSNLMVSDIEDWQITVTYGGHIATRVGTHYHATQREQRTQDSGLMPTFPLFPVVSFTTCRRRSRVARKAELIIT